MLKIKITLTRSPSLHEYGPEEDQVLGVFANVQLTYDILRVEGAHIGVYDDEKGAWVLHKNSPNLTPQLQGTVWSDMHMEPEEE